jgi:peptide deformylase
MQADLFLTHIDHAEDLPFLRTPLFDVNMRLFHANDSYKQIILDCCRYIELMAVAKFDDYKKPHGMSGANCAIPFNIIGIVKHRGTKGESVQIMINPKILRGFEDKIKTITNCGSIRLKEPIEVLRYECIEIQYYDTHGKRHGAVVNHYNGAFTIQHEVDHNQGILILDRVNG